MKKKLIYSNILKGINTRWLFKNQKKKLKTNLAIIGEYDK